MEKYSYMFGHGQRIAKYVTLPTYLDERAKDIPQKAAIIFRYRDMKKDNEINDIENIGRCVVSFKELAWKSKILAAAFIDIGIKPKDRVLMIGSNCPEFAFVDFACLRISALMIRLPLNLGTLDVLVDTLKKHDVMTLIIDDRDLAARIESAFPGLLGQDQHKYGTNVQRVLLLKSAEERIEWKTISDLLQYNGGTDKVMSVQMEQDPDDIAVLFPTSGSTGRPKHVMHSHFSFINGLFTAYEECLCIDNPEFVYLSDRSFSWSGGSPYISILFGITLVQIDAALLILSKSAKIFCEIAKQEDATDSFCMAYMLFDLKQHAKTDNISLSIKNIMSAGERLSTDLVDFTKKTFGRISLCYGSTEFTIASSRIQMVDDCQTADSLRWMNVAPGVEVKITDGTGRLVPRQQTGNVHVRCISSFHGYLDDEVKTSKTISDSKWNDLGDLGMMNEQGQLTLMGRDHDVISRGGNKVYPAMIEQILINNPKVLKVAVVGVPDPRLYQEICAFVIPETGADVTATDLKEYVHDQSLRGSRSLVMPKYFIFIDSFPITHTGKVDKGLLKKSAITQLQLE